MATNRKQTSGAPARNAVIFDVRLALASAAAAIGLIRVGIERSWWEYTLASAPFALFALYVFRRRGRRELSAPPEAGYALRLSDTSIKVVHGRRKTEEIPWRDVREIAVVTTAEGPFAPDVWLVFLGHERKAGVSFPTGAPLAKELIDRLVGLPDFDHAAFVQAMGSTEERMFVCWRGTGLLPFTLPNG